MKEYKTRDITTPIIEFIKTCPFLDEYNINMEDMGVQRIQKNINEGSAIDYAGGSQISNAKDLIRSRYSTKQANFNIWFSKRSGHNFYREENANFLWNFEQWIEHCQAYGLTPKLSNDENGKYQETMVANNGMFFSNWEKTDTSLYMIQLNIIYYTSYEDVI